MDLSPVVFADRPDLHEQADTIFSADWPEFIFHDPVADQYLDRVREYFRQLSLLLLDDDGRIAAGGWGVALRWDGSVGGLPGGYDDALRQAVELREAGGEADTLVIGAAQVRSDLQGQGVAAAMVRQLADAGVRAGLVRVIVPVRPALKARYPLTPMARFMAWTRPDGLPLDPWLRTHRRMGARLLGPAERSMVMCGSVAEWEEWAGMPLPDSGPYVVAGALAPVEVDRERDVGVLAEPNVWVRHR
ncbi:unnamed protein product [[Actinomadura] parvosata subsp. kistnae]|uniref:N-acetyltransferase domain-containing protein n=1 Tax=[Actinomadura] parvosata subsp. kistnae TaxID=1909395 RepID=A0A1V0A9W6_9ACTN|nr:hypothetical protein [Nonomuraea sp. ATCC 55076]AQZ67024.1 hypothetical protein BKM31_41220 [Nonomuraea sp. ATCC 55076]SPL94798.1 unnamed protein product [Actinomadura parvosata subsp. kistnae]